MTNIIDVDLGTKNSHLLKWTVAFKDYYDILGLPRDVNEAGIKKAFRRLARIYHPDSAKAEKASEEKFKQINEAYAVLGDPHQRSHYDELGEKWNSGPGGQPPITPKQSSSTVSHLGRVGTYRDSSGLPQKERRKHRNGKSGSYRDRAVFPVRSPANLSLKA